MPSLKVLLSPEFSSTPQACPLQVRVPRTRFMATFDLLLRLWVWPRPRSRLLREVWACVPAQRLEARSSGLGRARAAYGACGQGGQGYTGVQCSFSASGFWTQWATRPHPSFPPHTPLHTHVATIFQAPSIGADRMRDIPHALLLPGRSAKHSPSICQEFAPRSALVYTVGLAVVVPRGTGTTGSVLGSGLVRGPGIWI